MKLILVLIFTGLSGCFAPTSDAAFCQPRFTQAVTELKEGLLAYPETPDAVGEPATDIVRGHKAGCA
jgi:hypothetical protein